VLTDKSDPTKKDEAKINRMFLVSLYQYTQRSELIEATRRSTALDDEDIQILRTYVNTLCLSPFAPPTIRLTTYQMVSRDKDLTRKG